MLHDIQFYINEFKSIKQYMEGCKGRIDDPDTKLERCDVAIKALEREQKYGWHDLRKHQEDLPKDDNKRLVVTETQRGVRNYVLAYYCESLHRWASGMNSNVIAWKDIEPFEGA